MASDIVEIERWLWSTADQLRANSGLKPSEYSRPVLGLLFLRYADGRFAEAEKQLKPRPGSRLGAPTPDAFKARGVIFLTPEARFSHLLALPEGSNLGRALNQAKDPRWQNITDIFQKKVRTRDIFRQLEERGETVDVRIRSTKAPVLSNAFSTAIFRSRRSRLRPRSARRSTFFIR